MNDIMICSHCGCTTGYDKETTLYLKCPSCENILIDRKVEEKHLGTLVVVDYGIDYLENGDWMWVECEDSEGNKQTYWKLKNNFENFQKSC